MTPSTIVGSRVLETVAPARLGASFRWLLGAGWAANLGDGIALAAGPLLVASETRSPLLVSLAALLQYLPWLLFGLPAGVVADRVDRRWMIAAADLCRMAVLTILVGTLVADQVSIALVLVAMFLLGTGEVFSDTATSTVLPMLVHKSDLGLANSRIMGGVVVANQLVGPPIGAALFGVGRAWPFAVQALCVALAVVMVLRLRLPAVAPAAASLGDAPPRRMRQEMGEGLRWLWGHLPLRVLAITIIAFNVTFGAAWSVLVLYSSERLGLGHLGFGLITSASALGGLVGAASYGRLERRFSLGVIMRVGLVLETCTHLVLALTTWAWLAMVVFFLFGVHAFVWGTTSASVRQRAVPTQLQGRVTGVYFMGSMAGMVAGSLAGGLIAQHWGITAPFWCAFVGSAIFLVLIWRSLLHVEHADVVALSGEDGSGRSGQ